MQFSLSTVAVIVSAFTALASAGFDCEECNILTKKCTYDGMQTGSRKGIYPIQTCVRMSPNSYSGCCFPPSDVARRIAAQGGWDRYEGDSEAAGPVGAAVEVSA